MTVYDCMTVITVQVVLHMLCSSVLDLLQCKHVVTSCYTLRITSSTLLPTNITFKLKLECVAGVWSGNLQWSASRQLPSPTYCSICATGDCSSSSSSLRLGLLFFIFTSADLPSSSSPFPPCVSCQEPFPEP